MKQYAEKKDLEVVEYSTYDLTLTQPNIVYSLFIIFYF